MHLNGYIITLPLNFRKIQKIIKEKVQKEGI
jgi:hypothetical protein